MSLAHSKIGASSAHRWINCPGSVKLSEGIKSVSSDYALEGTKAHDLAAQIAEYVFKIGPRPNQDEWPEDMYKYCDEYVTKINEDYEQFKTQVFIEHTFDLSTVHPGAFGTADCVIYDKPEKTLRVYDFKYGQGVAVEAKNNTQLKYYALGCLLSLNLPVTEVELVIIQPRAYHPDGPVRRWTTTAMELLDFAADLKEYMLRTEDPKAPLNPGEHCRFCPAGGICPAMHSKALELAGEQFQPLQNYDKEKLAQILEWVPRLENWIKSVREFAYSEAQQGKTIPGYKLVEKRPTRKWVSSESDLKNAFPSLSDDDLYEKKLKTPAKLEKVLDKADKELLAAHYEKKSSGTTLVHESDKRQALSVGPASVFEKLDSQT